jgi:hypothetical protein
MEGVRFLNLEYLFLIIYEWLKDPAVPEGDIRLFLETVSPYATALVLLFAVGTVYSMIRLRQIRGEEKDYYDSHAEGASTTSGVALRNEKWERVERHMKSTNPNDWRLAILEADIMLDEMLSVLQYSGETMADKLKSVERSDFLTIDKAWEAHKVRNVIAHEGADFLLSDREAKRVIDLYREVFEEFHFV